MKEMNKISTSPEKRRMRLSIRKRQLNTSYIVKGNVNCRNVNHIHINVLKQFMMENGLEVSKIKMENGSEVCDTDAERWFGQMEHNIMESGHSMKQVEKESSHIQMETCMKVDGQ